MQKPKLIVVGGSHAVGKSFLCRQAFDIDIVYNFSKMRKGIMDPITKNNWTFLPEIGMRKDEIAFIEQLEGKNIVTETMSTTTASKLEELYGDKWDVKVIVLNIDPEQHYEAWKNRTRKEDKSKESKTWKMIEKKQDAWLKYYEVHVDRPQLTRALNALLKI